MEARFDRGTHFFPKLFFRNVSWRWRRGKKRNPDLLNCSRQFAARSRAFFDHAGATFAINRSKVWRETRWHLWIRTIRNLRTVQKFAEVKLHQFAECDIVLQ